MMQWCTVFMLGMAVQLSAAGFAQTIQLKETSSTLRAVFEEVEKQTGKITLFSNNELDMNRKVELKAGNCLLEELYRKILEGTKLAFYIGEEYIVIKRKEQIPLNAYPEKRQLIKGVVKDENGVTLPGVSVLIKGTQSGIATDVNGSFEIYVPGPEAILIFSFIGKKTQEIAVESKTYLEVVMQDGGKMLEEVVCTGIQTISRERATGSFEILNADQLNRTLTSDVISRLQGKVAGIVTDRNNKLLIRGRGSIYSDTEPLIVVDGFPIEGDLGSVNPDDITNITVLKDAAAASIWGVRAANGVVVITTKSGTGSNKTNLDVSYFLTVDSRPHMRDLHLMNAKDAVDLHLEQIQKGLWDLYYMTIAYPAANVLKEAYYNASQKVGSKDFATIIAEPEFVRRRQQLEKMDFAGQYEKMLLRHAVGNRLNIALRGGTEKNDYYLSGVYNRQLLEYVGDKNTNVLVNFKNNYRFFRRFSFASSMNIQYQQKENNGIDKNVALEEMPFNNLLDEQGNRIRYYALPTHIAQEKEAQGYLSYSKNLLEEQELNDKKTDVFSARLQGALKLNILDGLDVETRFQYERGYTKTENLDVIAKASTRALINDLTLVNTDGSLNRQLPLGDIYTENRSDQEAWTWRNQLTFNKEWKDDEHQISALLGHEMRKYTVKSHNQRLYGYDRVALNYVPVSEYDWYNALYKRWATNLMMYNNSLFNSYTETDNRDLSVYLNGAYTLFRKYTFSASGRIDQSNLFGNDSDYKYNFIWSAGFSWRLHEEKFLESKRLDLLLLRFTYGIGGNVNKSFYPVLMGRKRIMAGTGLPYIMLTNPANKDLTWEKSTTLNVGVDFALFEHRLGGSLDYYHKKGTDLLGTVALDPTNGFPSATMNFASVLNQGVELTLNCTPVKTRDIVWNIGFNMSYNKNEVLEIEVPGNAESDYLIPAPSDARGVVVEGKPLGRLYAYRYAGLNEQGEVMLWENGQKVHFSDYQKEPASLAYMGTTEAPYFGGLSTELTYKGITLSANATYKFGHKFRLPTGASSSIYVWTQEDATRRWKAPGDERHTQIPVLSSDWNVYLPMEQYYSWSDINVRNAAWLRLNEISLGYQVPGQYFRKLPVKSLSVQLQLRNVCLWTANKEHVDPEAVNPPTSIYSGAFYDFPQARSFIFGIKVTF